MRNVLRLSIFALSLLLFASCAEEEAKRTLPEFETFTYEVTQNNLNVSISYERITNTAAKNSFRIIDSMNYYNTFGDFATDNMDLEASSKLLVEDIDLDMSLFGSYIDSEMRIYQVAYFVRDDSIVCYDTCTETDFGGPHPLTTQTYDCYDIATGSLYDFSYLAEGEWLPALQQLIYDDLVRQHGDDILISDASHLHIPNALHITDNGLMFHYEAYEVGDFSLGSVNVELSDKELSEAGVMMVWK